MVKEMNNNLILISIVAVVAIVGMIALFSGMRTNQESIAGSAWNNKLSLQSSSIQEPAPTASITPSSNIAQPLPVEPTPYQSTTGYECDYEGQVVPFNQGLINYELKSDASTYASGERVDMGRRFSVVDKELASHYLILNSIGKSKMIDVVFSMLEYYSCEIPDWLHEKLEGLYLIKYQGDDVVRASVLVLKDRETTEYVAQLLYSLSTDELEKRNINGNEVYYTAQKSYWWTHDNTIIRIASHMPPTKADRYGNVVDLRDDLRVCETLDVLDGTMANCINDNYWKEVPQDILYQYLAKLPSDANEISPAPAGQFANIYEGDDAWPTDSDWTSVQQGCAEQKSKPIWDAIGNPWEQDKDGNNRILARTKDKVIITDAATDKRWYYLGETVTILGSAVSVDGNFGNVRAEVKDDIYPNPEFTTVGMTAKNCGERVPYVEQQTGYRVSKYR